MLWVISSSSLAERIDTAVPVVPKNKYRLPSSHLGSSGESTVLLIASVDKLPIKKLNISLNTEPNKSAGSSLDPPSQSLFSKNSDVGAKPLNVEKADSYQCTVAVGSAAPPWIIDVTIEFARELDSIEALDNANVPVPPMPWISKVFADVSIFLICLVVKSNAEPSLVTPTIVTKSSFSNSSGALLSAKVNVSVPSFAEV